MACTNPNCFFCIMKEPDSSIKRTGITNCFKKLPLIDDELERVLVLCSVWSIAMAQPDDPEFPSLGIFKCMASVLSKCVSDRDWLLNGQNIYVPYYAAHIIGSYTMNKSEFAEEAVDSGVIPPLLDLLRGKMTWVEQRVAVRALGHLASYETTFEAVAEHEEEIVKLAMQLASTCGEVVYTSMFTGNVEDHEDEKLELIYHGHLLTRGVGGIEMKNKKAEEWASQIQCWSLHLLNCFGIRGRERSIDLICNNEFLKDLCGMWGGLVNHASPAGIGLIRILCYTELGRRRVAQVKEVVENLCNLSRSSDDWQYMGIDCLLLLLRDPNTRYKVLGIAVLCLVDLVEIKNLGGREKFGQRITRALLSDFRERGSSIECVEARKALKEVWVLKVERRRREKLMTGEKSEEKRVMSSLIKQQGNRSFSLGKIAEALAKYTEALELCPLKLRRERIVLHSNRAQCHLLLNDPDSAISDTTRALCLSSPPNSHAKSLWRRSQAYDMKGLAKESLMDALMFVNTCINSDMEKIPYYAVRMMNRQMDSTWFFAAARSKISGFNHPDPKVTASRNFDAETCHDETAKSELLIRMAVGKMTGLSTILEEPANEKKGNGRSRKLERGKRSKNAILTAKSMQAEI